MKEISDAVKRFLLENGGLEEVALDLHIRKGVYDVAGSGSRERRSLRGSIRPAAEGARWLTAPGEEVGWYERSIGDVAADSRTRRIIDSGNNSNFKTGYREL